MKQGQSTSKMAGTKIEPRSRAVNPKAVAEIGVHQVRKSPVNLFEGRGLHAPMVSKTVHPKGSQGKR
jgi:hypothetical protein